MYFLRYGKKMFSLKSCESQEILKFLISGNLENHFVTQIIVSQMRTNYTRDPKKDHIANSYQILTYFNCTLINQLRMTSKNLFEFSIVFRSNVETCQANFYFLFNTIFKTQLLNIFIEFRSNLEFREHN